MNDAVSGKFRKENKGAPIDGNLVQFALFRRDFHL